MVEAQTHTILYEIKIKKLYGHTSQLGRLVEGPAGTPGI